MKLNPILWKRIALGVWLALWPLLALALWYPIRFAGLRAAMVVALAGLVGGAVLLGWKLRPIRWAGAILSLLVLACAVAPGRAVDAQALRREYVDAMQSYQGTPYVWGGETRRGIDCSGLMRCGLIDACARRGLGTLDPALVREAFSLWWHDSSARELKQGYSRRTRLLFQAPGVNAIDSARLEPGDMAVTSNGVHVLAYVGGQTWIEADPSALVGDQVVQVQVPAQSPWFRTPVHVMRWRRLDG